MVFEGTELFKSAPAAAITSAMLPSPYEGPKAKFSSPGATLLSGSSLAQDQSRNHGFKDTQSPYEGPKAKISYRGAIRPLQKTFYFPIF